MVRPSLWTERGLMRTGRLPVGGLGKDFRGHDADISGDMDWTRMRTVHGRGLSADIACPLPGHGHGLDMDADSQTGHGADISQPFRGQCADTESFIDEGVGRAGEKIGSNMM